MTDKEKLNKIVEALYYGSKAEFARILGISPQTVTNWMNRGISKDGIALIQKSISLINPKWLLTGEGDMLKNLESDDINLGGKPEGMSGMREEAVQSANRQSVGLSDNPASNIKPYDRLRINNAYNNRPEASYNRLGDKEPYTARPPYDRYMEAESCPARQMYDRRGNNATCPEKKPEEIYGCETAPYSNTQSYDEHRMNATYPNDRRSEESYDRHAPVNYPTRKPYVRHDTYSENKPEKSPNGRETITIRHTDDSMVEYPNGCTLIVREVKDRHLLVPGRDYVIETSEYQVVKRVQCGNSPNTIMLYSTNTEKYDDGRLIYEPFEVKLEDIKHIFSVIGLA